MHYKVCLSSLFCHDCLGDRREEERDEIMAYKWTSKDEKKEEKPPTSLIMTVSLGFADVMAELSLKDLFERGQRFGHTAFCTIPGHSKDHMTTQGFQNPD